jgi:hypothetical protein
MFCICTIGNERIVIPARGSGVPAGGIKKEKQYRRDAGAANDAQILNMSQSTFT